MLEEHAEVGETAHRLPIALKPPRAASQGGTVTVHQHVQPTVTPYATVTDRYVRYACPDLSADASGGLGPRAPLRFLFYVPPLPRPPPRDGRPPHLPRIQSRIAHVSSVVHVCRARGEMSVIVWST